VEQSHRLGARSGRPASCCLLMFRRRMASISSTARLVSGVYFSLRSTQPSVTGPIRMLSLSYRCPAPMSHWRLRTGRLVFSACRPREECAAFLCQAHHLVRGPSAATNRWDSRS